MSSGFVNRVQTTAQGVAKDDYGRAKVLLADATKSRAYIYPIKGIFYFITHRSLWKPLASRILPVVILTVGVVASMFFLTYLPQLAIMALFNGPLAVFTTVLLVLNESSAIISIVSRTFLLQEALLDTFDGTLVSRGQIEVVKEGRQVTPGSDPVARLGKILKNPFEKFSLTYIVRYIMYLPLNFIPVVGTIVFIGLQALIGRFAIFQPNYGTVATLLEMGPFVSILFSFTNTVGAALWAADIETRNAQMGLGTAPNLREAMKKSE